MCSGSTSMLSFTFYFVVGSLAWNWLQMFSHMCYNETFLSYTSCSVREWFLGSRGEYFSTRPALGCLRFHFLSWGWMISWIGFICKCFSASTTLGTFQFWFIFHVNEFLAWTIFFFRYFSPVSTFVWVFVGVSCIMFPQIFWIHEEFIISITFVILWPTWIFTCVFNYMSM